MYDIYSNARKDTWRFTLGKSGSRKLLTVGLNPSTATKEKSDTTVAKVEGVAQRNGFDGFVMLNLYPVRSTDFNALPFDVDAEAFSENLSCIEALVAADPTSVVWAAWGENIHARSYFVAAARVNVCPVTKVRHDLAALRNAYQFGASTASLAFELMRGRFSKLDTPRYVQTLGT